MPCRTVAGFALMRSALGLAEGGVGPADDAGGHGSSLSGWRRLKSAGAGLVIMESTKVERRGCGQGGRLILGQPGGGVHGREVAVGPDLREPGLGPGGETVTQPPRDLQLLVPEGTPQPPLVPGGF